MALSIDANDRLIVQDLMLDVNVLAAPLRGLDKLVEKACESTEPTQKVCLVVAKIFQATLHLIPESIRNETHRLVSESQRDLEDNYLIKFGIPKEETRFAIDSFEHLIAASTGGAIGAAVARLPNALRNFAFKVKLLPERFTNKPFLPESFREKVVKFTSATGKGRLEYAFMSRSDGTLRVYVELLTAMPIVKTSGLTFNALKEIKRVGLANTATKLQLQFVPANVKLFEITKKSYPYLGEKPLFPLYNNLAGEYKAPLFLISEGRFIQKRVSRLPARMGAALGLGLPHLNQETAQESPGQVTLEGLSSPQNQIPIPRVAEEKTVRETYYAAKIKEPEPPYEVSYDTNSFGPLIVEFLKDPKGMSQAVIKAPEKIGRIVKKVFKTLTGHHHKKKKKPGVKASNGHTELLGRQIAASMAQCHATASRNGALFPEKSLEEYANDLFADWQKALSTKKWKEKFPEYLAFIQSGLGAHRYAEVYKLSPSAHVPNPLLSSSLLPSLINNHQQTEALAVQKKEIVKLSSQLSVTTTKMDKAYKGLAAQTAEFSTFLTNNEERIKAALRAKITVLST